MVHLPILLYLVSAVFYGKISSPLCAEKKIKQKHFYRKISKPKVFRDRIHLTISVTWVMPANMAFRWVEVFTISGKRLCFADFFYLLINLFPVKGREWENLDYMSNTSNIYIIHGVRKRLYPFLFFFSRCPLCGEWCKLH